jgi:hypothetical protein
MARRIGLFVLVVFVVLGARLLFQRPVEATLVLGFGKRCADLRKAELVVSDKSGGVVRTLSLRFENGAAPEERRVVRLPPGDYTVGAHLSFASGEPITLSRSLRVAQSGSYPIDLSNPANLAP